LIVLTSRLTDNQIEIPAMSRIEIRAKNIYDEMKLNLSIYNKGRLRKTSMAEGELVKWLHITETKNLVLNDRIGHYGYVSLDNPCVSLKNFLIPSPIS